MAFRWVGLKPIGHPAVEFFDKGIGFSWRTYRDLGTGYTCVDSVMGLFVDTRNRFTAITVPGSYREGICTPAMHRYWQAVMTSFEKELLGSRGFSLIPPDGLSAIIYANPRLLLPFKSVLAYARKQSRSAIFEWVKKDRRWFWHANDYPTGWEKKVKVTKFLC